jgi:ornithine decarboxylase
VEEMRAVLSLGVNPSLILFANPYKSAAAIDFARRAGVMLTTFDNIDELEKIIVHIPGAALLLRIHANDEKTGQL